MESLIDMGTGLGVLINVACREWHHGSQARHRTTESKSRNISFESGFCNTLVGVLQHG